MQEIATEIERVEQARELLREFELMRDTAELKALSNASLERPLNNEEFAKMMALKKAVFVGG